MTNGTRSGAWDTLDPTKSHACTLIIETFPPILMLRLTQVTALALALVGLASSPAGAQGRARLGPVDGLDLPPLDTGRVAIATTAPDFTLESRDGGTITLSQFRGRKNVVLVFYRGHW